MDGISIRAAAEGDRAALLQVRSSTTDVRDDLISRRLQLQADGSAEYLVLLVDQRIVGFIVLKWNGNVTHPEYPYMEDLFIQEEHRGAGHGTRLISECERLAKERGASMIGLAVNPHENQRAMLLYASLGYRHDGGQEYLDGVYDGKEDWVVDMAKSL
ncbi:hypothetical protein AUK40_01665 [Candidatus Wirthbacteria bacterium CG2_30_54_11]|uniref:N-acetyltransferase domain-containing protein n=1 Tax=Candidatus Wirthbacteria bacterium CG2_30_54_11 TaxID=1817892 RepID=A0A1J5J4F5_9BACT|nr:MAG: hypothetical protein AUK40_01665 [Candidatus Wirthbacteria bacterium CG2_30_54_11]